MDITPIPVLIAARSNARRRSLPLPRAKVSSKISIMFAFLRYLASMYHICLANWKFHDLDISYDSRQLLVEFPGSTSTKRRNRDSTLKRLLPQYLLTLFRTSFILGFLTRLSLLKSYPTHLISH